MPSFRLGKWPLALSHANTVWFPKILQPVRQSLDPFVQVYAGNVGWLNLEDAMAQSQQAAGGVLFDVGTTTTDIVPFAGGQVLQEHNDDADNLASAIALAKL